MGLFKADQKLLAILNCEKFLLYKPKVYVLCRYGFPRKKIICIFNL